MSNDEILALLEIQRDSVYENLKGTTISGLYKEKYEDLKAGTIFVVGSHELQMANDLKNLSEDTSLDGLFADKLREYSSLDNEALVAYFKEELEGVLAAIRTSGKQDEIQALFITYDFYYHFTSVITCYGQQAYPLIEVPRYISEEYDYTKEVFLIEEGISFQPAWIECEAFEDLDYLEINFELQELFVLHSRVLLHKALRQLEDAGHLDFLINRPFSFYIHQHDCEVMILYRVQ